MSPFLAPRMDMSSMTDSTSTTSTSSTCTMSMIWHWDYENACFISDQWQVTSLGGFVGTIIGVFFITLAIECCRRLSRDYDRTIKVAYYKREMSALAAYARNTNKEIEEIGDPAPFRPSNREHLIRSAFYGVQFSAAYVLMLLAMSFSGPIILAIFAGGFVGHSFFARDTATPFELPKDDPVAAGGCCC